MVSIKSASIKSKTVDVTLDIHDIFDIINGLNILVGNKESEMNRFDGGDSADKEQYQRYKRLLAEMQRVKGLVK